MKQRKGHWRSIKSHSYYKTKHNNANQTIGGHCIRWRLDCAVCVIRFLPGGSLWCNGPCWNTGGTGNWVGVFCWAFLALKKGRGRRNGPSGSWVHPQCCSRSRRVTHSYTHCCSGPTKWETHDQRVYILTSFVLRSLHLRVRIIYFKDYKINNILGGLSRSVHPQFPIRGPGGVTYWQSMVENNTTYKINT